MSTVRRGCETESVVNMSRWRVVRSTVAVVVAIASVSLASGCADESDAEGTGVLDGIGRLPGYDFWASVTLPDGVRLELPMPEGGPIGGRVDGNRVLLVGDSILASTAKRYSDEACEALEPLGWQAAVEAEPGRFASFGVDVLERRIDSGWDVVIIYLGTNYEGNEESLRRQFDRMFEITDGVETVVLTTGVFRDAQRTVNRVIEESAAEFDHVHVLDWSKVAGLDGITVRDGIHLTEIGRAALAQTLARALDYAPLREPSCLDPQFTDDSGITAQSTTTNP